MFLLFFLPTIKKNSNISFIDLRSFLYVRKFWRCQEKSATTTLVVKSSLTHLLSTKLIKKEKWEKRQQKIYFIMNLHFSDVYIKPFKSTKSMNKKSSHTYSISLCVEWATLPNFHSKFSQTATCGRSHCCAIAILLHFFSCCTSPTKLWNKKNTLHTTLRFFEEKNWIDRSS